MANVDAYVDLGTPPWFEPTEDRVAAARIEHFRNWARGQGFPAQDFSALWQWSVDQPESFWSALWEYFELPATTGPALADAPRPVRPGIRWFPEVRLNYTGEIFRRLTRSEHDAALLAMTETGDQQTITWGALRQQVASLAEWLRAHQVGPGDRVVGYLPDIPEATIAFLATAAVGATWAACGQDYAPPAALARLGQLTPKVLIASAGYSYAGQQRDRGAESEEVRQGLPDLHAALLVGEGSTPTGWTPWQEAVQNEVPLQVESLPFEHPLWVLFSSGTTGKPKGIMHGHGGVILEHLKMLALYGDLGADSVFWWQTSPSWMMWNYRTSALLLGSTVVSYSGSPTWPTTDALWRIASRLGVTFLGTSPAYLLACRQAGISLIDDLDLSPLQVIGSTGAPLPAEAHTWVAAHAAPGIPISSITGGTDVVTAFAAASPVDSVWAGEISRRCLGADLQAFDGSGQSVVGEVGELVLTTAMPSMPVGFWDDPSGARLSAAYFERYPGAWCHGDWVTITERGTLVMHGRSDSTLNRQGVRMGSSEIYEAIERLPQVRDGLIVGVDRAHGSYWMPLFVHLADGVELDDALRTAIVQSIREHASPRHVPDEIIAVPGIPRTRTGKRLEVPIKRLLAGAELDQVVDRNAVDDPGLLDWFNAYARAHA